MTRVPYNKLLTNLASSSRTGEYWPSVVLYGPRANIPRYGPRARLVRGYYLPTVNGEISISKVKIFYGFYSSFSSETSDKH